MRHGTASRQLPGSRILVVWRGKAICPLVCVDLLADESLPVCCGLLADQSGWTVAGSLCIPGSHLAMLLMTLQMSGLWWA